MSIVSGILIGVFCAAYVFNMTFRHIVNIVLIFLCKIPLRIVEFIDVTFCSAYYYKVKPKSEVIKSEPVKRVNHPADKIYSIKNLDGTASVGLETDAKLKEWLARNPDLKVG